MYQNKYYKDSTYFVYNQPMLLTDNTIKTVFSPLIYIFCTPNDIHMTLKYDKVIFDVTYYYYTFQVKILSPKLGL